LSTGKRPYPAWSLFRVSMFSSGVSVVSLRIDH
jgi:hypothetical protein